MWVYFCSSIVIATWTSSTIFTRSVHSESLFPSFAEKHTAFHGYMRCSLWVFCRFRLSGKGDFLFLVCWDCFLNHAAAAAAKLPQSYPTLCNPIDSSPPGSSIPGILQARTLEWVAISFSNAWKWKVKVKSLSRVILFTTPWTEAYQAPPSMGFSRQEYCSGLPLPSLFKSWMEF